MARGAFNSTYGTAVYVALGLLARIKHGVWLHLSLPKMIVFVVVCWCPEELEEGVLCCILCAVVVRSKHQLVTVTQEWSRMWHCLGIQACNHALVAL